MYNPQQYGEQTLAWSDSVLIENGEENMLYSAAVSDPDKWQIEALLANCVERAVDLLAVNIEDDSLYLMFEWNTNASVLTVVVCDDSKRRDAKHRVRCDMSAMNAKIKQLSESEQWKYKGESFADIVKHGLHDYLTTCTGFMRYSLVAVFHQGSRQHTELL
ncbi:MAG: hypothetical protein P1U47_07525 [Zhongshania sp.]|uniref:hypothetical protein n=1 Tax=Zhongshania sp. TaxID=1971902 RepID=UPI002606214B|nr:hypothetical protein [Zhongshania sp.]MDF1692205.1 hypothetical protein [Zhongshania sp.]